MSAGAAKVHLQAVHKVVERLRQRLPYLVGLKTEALEDLLRELSRIDASLRRAGRELSKMDARPTGGDPSPLRQRSLDLGDHQL